MEKYTMLTGQNTQYCLGINSLQIRSLSLRKFSMLLQRDFATAPSRMESHVRSLTLDGLYAARLPRQIVSGNAALTWIIGILPLSDFSCHVSTPAAWRRHAVRTKLVYVKRSCREALRLHEYPVSPPQLRFPGV